MVQTFDGADVSVERIDGTSVSWCKYFIVEVILFRYVWMARALCDTFEGARKRQRSYCQSQVVYVETDNNGKGTDRHREIIDGSLRFLVRLL